MIEITDGVYTDLSSEDYHGHKASISRSAIMDFDRSPHTYWAKHLNPARPKKDATPAMQMGSAFHAMILEPNTLQDEYIVLPEPVFLKDVGRERYDAYKQVLYECEITAKTVIPFKTYQELDAMRLALLKNENAMNLIRESRIENSLFWTDKDTGMLLKSRPDILHSNIIVDLKTTSDASPRAFQYEMVKYGYHIQFAMIRDAVEQLEGRRIENFINIVIETKYPFNTAIYLVDEDAVDQGQLRYKEILVALKSAIGHNTFDDYGIQTIGLPRWAM